ncbi:integral membrane protein (macronuclear) [Tetrahymena thermophila SB210]|uniref:Integral membrane protein n=1 Tax=Tetrahymena thermophila (strain SB210) TaxID=312017 RepID=Q23FA1_TETTS|nr:integral membrane protein [Tetrahymena thermophila SB210]EAR95252.2 integral membrane protein [Tetrahymena thermophila SB210]|eukprot:XP_001015497.2 integral membrane protein [Tetrahymena thermophila SB210]
MSFENVHDISVVNFFLVVVCAIATSSIAEFATWLIVYRRDEYKTLKQNIENSQNKLNKAQEVYLTFSQQAAHDKKLATIDTALKRFNQEMSSFKMKSTFLIAIFMIGALYTIGSLFSGLIVAKLPFAPISFITGLTHRGLSGEDFSDCAYIFIYVQVAYIWRTNIQKLFGFEAPKSPMASPWGQPPQWGK